VDQSEGTPFVSAEGVPGPADDDGRGAGPAAQHPTGEGSPALAPVAVATPEMLTEGHTTTRRMRINVTRNTKGYSYDTTFEVASDDPEAWLHFLTLAGLQEADEVARTEIARREALDQAE